MKYDRDSDDRPPLPGAGYLEDYTGPFLVTFGVLIFVVLFALWALFGLPLTVVLALLSERVFLRG